MNSDEAKDLLSKFEPKEVKVLEIDRQVNAARFSPCGKFLFAGGFEGEVRRWNMVADESPQLDPITGHSAWVQPLAFHPRDPVLFTADSWGQLRAWTYGDDETTPKWTLDSAHDGWIRDLSVSADGEWLASCGLDRKIRIWSTRDGKLQRKIADHQHDVYAVRFHPSLATLVSSDERGIVKLWHAADGKLLRKFDASSLYLLHRLQDVGGSRVLAFDREGKTLAVGGTVPKNGATVLGVPTVLLFDYESGQLKHTLELGKANDCFVHDVFLHNAGFVMAVTSGTPGSGQLLMQRPEDNEPFFRYKKMANCHSLSFHPDGRHFAVTATNKGSNGNGRQLTKDGEYVGNNTPIHLFEIPEQAT